MRSENGFASFVPPAASPDADPWRRERRLPTSDPVLRQNRQSLPECSVQSRGQGRLPSTTPEDSGRTASRRKESRSALTWYGTCVPLVNGRCRARRPSESGEHGEQGLEPWVAGCLGHSPSRHPAPSVGPSQRTAGGCGFVCVCVCAKRQAQPYGKPDTRTPRCSFPRRLPASAGSDGTRIALFDRHACTPHDSAGISAETHLA